MGAESIEVSDNGCGIEEENYAGIAMKHHTSKITTFNDVNSVSSFGFRGEALNALCELSGCFSMKTKHAKGGGLGAALTFERNGSVKSSKPIARGHSGTTVLIERLFEVLPVRRGEFIRSIKKQYQRLLKVLQSYAVISVGVKFNVVNISPDGSSKTAIATQATAKMEDNVCNIFGRYFFASFLPVLFIFTL